MKRAGHLIEIEVIIGTIIISEIGTILEVIGIEVNIIQVIEETLRIETGHMIEDEVGIETIEEDLVRIQETVDLGIGVDPCLVIEVKREGVITAENQDIL